MDFALTAARTETVIGSRQCGDLSRDDGDLKIRQLVRHPVDKFRSRQAVSKARNIVTARNQRSPTPAGVHDAHLAPESGEINRSHQAGRAAPNDDAIDVPKPRDL